MYALMENGKSLIMFDSKFDGTENEIGVRPGEEGPRPPSQGTEAKHEDMKRLERIMKERGIL